MCMIANEFQNIMKVIIIVLNNLYESNKEEGEVNNEQLCEVFYKFLKIYFATHEESFTNRTCDELRVRWKLFVLTFINF